jgi:beta-galactosidase
MPVLRITDQGFLLDEQPWRIVSGALHYFRVHPDQWADRLRKARLLGLNAIDTYVPWNLHERRPGEFRLDGPLDLPRFLDLAAAEGLHVLLRPGPYICAEWEGGGLPSWLLRDPQIVLRSNDPRYLAALDGYFAALLPGLERHFAPHGPVIALQVENEFGALGAQVEPGVYEGYLDHVAKRLAEHAPDLPLFTSDQADDAMLAVGGLPGVLRTVNFDLDVAASVAALRRHQSDGPLMATEFWIGWFDHWGGPHHVRSAESAAAALDELLAAGASVNMYMFHGGTNFGFANGANDRHRYTPTITSYDYDSPLDEAGDPTPKYAAFREVIARHVPAAAAIAQAEGIPGPAPKLAVAGIELTESAGLLASAAVLAEEQLAPRPLSMEELGQDFGFVLYRTVLEAPEPGILRLGRYGDRAQVFLDGQPLGALERERREHALALTDPRPGAVLELLVENQGRVNYGVRLADRKGLLEPVTLAGRELAGWSCRPLTLDSLAELEFAADGEPLGPAFHRGVFEIDDPADTYLHVDGWTKGNAWVNGFHLGRYWSRGPQRSLYVPGPVLRPGANEIVLLELDAAAAARTVELRDRPDLGPVES